MELTFFAAFVLKCVSWQLFSCGSFIFDEAVHAVRKRRTGSMEYFNFIGEKDWDQFDFSQVDFKAAYDWILEHFRRLVQAAVSAGVPFAAVTDEIGLGVVPQTYLGREFRDILGKINQFLAKSAQDVWLVISGIPVKIKDGGQTFGEADIR